MTREIQLTQGKVAIVDDEDYEFLNQYKWHAFKLRHRDTFYARRCLRTPGGTRDDIRTIWMHREILEVQSGTQVDHIDHDGLNNQRHNLRPCTNQQNQWNRPLLKANTSGYIGVGWKNSTGKWEAQIRHEGKNVFLGTYWLPEEAAKAYDDAALRLRGEFAQLNFRGSRPGQ